MILLPTTHFDTLAFDSPLKIEERHNSDGTRYLCVRLYNATGAALVAGRPYVVEYDGDEETNPSVITPAALAVYQHVVFATEATATASWGWFVIQGTYDGVLVEGTTDVAKDDYLDCTPGTSAVALIKDHSTVRSTASVARACAAQAANSIVATRCYIFGDRVLVP